MKPLLQFCCIAAVATMFGCHGLIRHNDTDSTQVTANGKIPVPVATESHVINSEEDLPGYWVGSIATKDVLDTNYEGDEYPDKINLSIDAINGSKVNGHSILAGKFRPFSGTVKYSENTYHFLVKEHGNNKNNGSFKFSVRTGDTSITGKWTANKKIENSELYYNLTKRSFKYNPNLKLDRGGYVDQQKERKVKKKDTGEYVDNRPQYAMATGDYAKFNASTQLLTTDDVANLKAADLLLLRNSIFARHGYAFKKPALRSFFEPQDWYIPVSTDVSNSLTPLEKKNVALLMRYEKNAQEYYDSYGR